MKFPVDQHICDLLNEKLAKLEKELKADIFSYYGQLISGSEPFFAKLISQVKKRSNLRRKYRK